VKLKYVLLFEALVVGSVILWRIGSVRYDLGNYDTMLVSNFGGTLLLNIGSSMLLILLVLTLSRHKTSTLIPLAITSYLVVSFAGPTIANFPDYVHRDVYLHLPYSLQILDIGHVPKDIGRWDVYSFPGAFIYYAIFMGVTGVKQPKEVGAVMNVLYTIILAISLLYLAKQLKVDKLDCERSLCLVFLLMPFISRYAPAPSFPHRYHLAFVLSMIFTGFLTKIRLNTAKLRIAEAVAVLLLIFTSVVFTHVHFSTYLTIAVSLYGILMLTKRGGVNRHVMLLFLPTAVAYALHLLYLTNPMFIREAYSFVTELKYLPIFLETSTPIRVRAQSLFINNLAIYVRAVWRFTLAAIAIYAFLSYTLSLIRKNANLYSLAYIVATLILAIPLVESLLWWERALVFAGTASILAINETLQDHLKRCRKALCWKETFLLALFILAILISPLVRWERPLVADMWQGSEKEVFLKALCSTQYTKIYIGASTGVDYTYCVAYVNPLAPNAIAIFDSRRGVLRKDPIELELPYAVSVRDPEFQLLNFNLIHSAKSLLYNSQSSYLLV